MDDIRMDSHKLIYHPVRVAKWLTGKDIFPIEIEVGLSGICNHRCIFCAVDYMEYKPNFIDYEMWLRQLKCMGKHGLKSIIYAGEGEPLLHKHAADIIVETKRNGIDAAMSTNAVRMTREFSEQSLGSLTWVRISIAGGTAETYSKIHQCRPEDFQRALNNVAAAVEVKRKRNLDTTIGAQLLLLPENKDEVVDLALTLREIGVDYFTIKPFSKHPLSKSQVEVDYHELGDIEKQLDGIETEEYKIFFRNHAIGNLGRRKAYNACHGLNYMCNVDAAGNVFPCIAFMGIEKYRYGNINDAMFDEIWHSERSRSIREHFNGDVLKTECREACRLDEMNKYLNELKHPNGHVNFI